MKIGYACLALAVPGSELKSCTLKNATEERLLSLTEHNLDALEHLIDYNIQNGILLFRISSDLIPFGSAAAKNLPWERIFASKLQAIGQKIQNAGMRVSMHPGQYTVLNSPDESVVQRAVKDLLYHDKVLSALGLNREHKIILHLGGAYGDKEHAKARFLSGYRELTPSVRSRLVLENDDRIFHIGDILETAGAEGIPVIFDTLHNFANPCDPTLSNPDWIRRCSSTWRTEDGPQKIHYSEQHPDRKPGAHSESVRIDAFLTFYRELAGMDLDIMLEVKDKNLSALKCINTVTNRGMSALESEWARYKYSVLEHSPVIYQSIRTLLKDKDRYPALEMYRMIETALDTPLLPGPAVNAAQHVWGYFKTKASVSEQTRFQRALDKYAAGESELQPVKSLLNRLAAKYNENYLLNAYYFSI